jgi:hypothetical protein
MILPDNKRLAPSITNTSRIDTLNLVNRPGFDAHHLLRGIMPNKWDTETKEKLFA